MFTLVPGSSTSRSDGSLDAMATRPAVGPCGGEKNGIGKRDLVHDRVGNQSLVFLGGQAHFV